MIGWDSNLNSDLAQRTGCQACRHREIHRPDRTSTTLRRLREKKKLGKDEGILGKK